MKGPNSHHLRSNSLPLGPKAAEAELISKATQTAIIAARSILMSGGTEESALKTAKAAAESVLNPAASDNETVSGRSTFSSFGGKRRKAKRQAEVVASMALMSATSLHPNGSGAMETDSVHKMYGRNIITVRQDEPSVLSGSTRPPRPPTPNASQNALIDRLHQQESREPNEHNATAERHGNRLPPSSPSSIISSAFSNIMKKDDDTEADRQLATKVLSKNSSMESENQSSVESSGRSSSEDESDEDSATAFTEVKKEPKIEQQPKVKATKTSWNIGDALMSPFTATMKILHCGPTPGDIDGLDTCHSRSTRRGRRLESSCLDRRDDTFDDETTAFSYGKNKKVKGKYRDPDFATSYDSYDSEITDDSEGDIQVRSSIRDTMESIVSKSKMSYRKSKLNEERMKKSSTEPRWKSYETKQKPPKSVGANSRRLPPSSSGRNSKSKRPPISPSVKRRATSFFRKDRGRR